MIMKLKGIHIKAFRLFDKVDLSFVNKRFEGRGSANFVSLYAPNGFGKTSLFDAIEFGMTGNIHRLKLGNFDENMKSEKKLSDIGTFIHNKRMPEEDVQIRLDLEGYKVKTVTKVVTQDEENGLLMGKPENSFFTKAILSQDWFSEFLSVNDAETRFKLFMENFHESEDLLGYHSQLKSLRTSLSRELGNLNRDLKKVQKKLLNDVDDRIVDHIDQQVADLKDLEVNVGWKRKIDETSLKELQIIAERIIGKLDLSKKKIDEIIANCEKLREGQGGLIPLDKLDSHLAAINEKNKQITSIKEKLDRVLRLKKLIELIIQLGKEKKDYLDSIKKLQYLIDKYPQYKKSLAVINEKGNEIVACDNEMKLLSEQVEKQTLEKKQFDDIVQQQNVQLAAITNKLDHLDEEYAKYQHCLKNIEADKKLIVELTASIAILVAAFESKNKVLVDLRNFQQKVYNRKVDAETETFPEQTMAIIKLNQTIAKCNKEIEALTINIDQQTAYLGQIGQLLSKSREVVSELKSGICPLCGHDYSTVEQLLKNIEDNHSVSDAISIAIKQRDALVEEKKNRQQELERLYQQIEKQLEGTVNKSTKEIEAITADRGKQEAAMAEAKKSIAVNQELVDREYVDFKNLSKEQVYKTYTERITKINEDIRVTSSKVEELKKLIDTQTTSIKLLEAKRLEARKVITKIQNQEDFINYKKMIGDEPIDDLSLALWNARISSMKETVAKYDPQISQAEGEVKELKEKYQTDVAAESIFSNELSKCQSEKDSLSESYFKTLQFLKKECDVKNVTVDSALDDIRDGFDAVVKKNLDESAIIEKKLTFLADYIKLLDIAGKYNQQQQVKKEIEAIQKNIQDTDANHKAVVNEIERLQAYLVNYVKNFFQTDRIQQLYNTIDPHPEYKEIKFECDFTYKEPRLHIYMESRSKGQDPIVPTLYFSTAQINILSFCIFMARALFAKTDDGQDVGCVFIDDPIQALDDINILSMIDMLRNVAFSLDRQIVMTTHDLNFFELLQKKIPQSKFNACYLRLVERGKFETVQ